MTCFKFQIFCFLLMITPNSWPLHSMNQSGLGRERNMSFQRYPNLSPKPKKKQLLKMADAVEAMIPHNTMPLQLYEPIIRTVQSGKMVFGIVQINCPSSKSKSMVSCFHCSFWLCYQRSQLQSLLASTFPWWIVLHFHHWTDCLLSWKKQWKNSENEVQKS